MPAIGPCLFAFVVFACGCDARFIDLRPLAERPGSSGLPDLAGGDLAGGDLAGLDLAASEGVIARGPFTGRAGHVGTGAALLVRSSVSCQRVQRSADATSLSTASPFASRWPRPH